VLECGIVAFDIHELLCRFVAKARPPSAAGLLPGRLRRGLHGSAAGHLVQGALCRRLQADVPAVPRPGSRSWVTSGIATHERVLEEQPETIAAVVRAFRRALDDIHTQPALREAVERVGRAMGAIEPLDAAGLHDFSLVAAATR
jgi:hypothetical protein